MNKRIWELADQCQEYRPGFDGQEDWYTVFNKQKFAELIIRECMRMCDVAAVGYEEHGDIKEANGCVLASKYIAEHFEVE
jgi:hypothetical protein